MNNESTPTITEADIARIRQQVRSSALEVESLIVANQLMAARITELERLLERGKPTVHWANVKELAAEVAAWKEGQR